MAVLKNENVEYTEEERQALFPGKTSRKFEIIGYAIVTMTALSYFIAFTSSQISGLQLNIFELFLGRYLILFMLVSILVAYKREPLKISAEHLKYVAVLIVIDVIQSSCTYTATTFMPVGNMDAFHNAVFILAASLYDIINKQITKFRMFCAFIIIFGIVLLSQPWYIPDREDIRIPCEYLNHFKDSAGKNDNLSDLTYLNYTPNHAAFQNEHGATWIFSHQKLVGYLLIVLGALGHTVRSNLAKYLQKHYSGCVVLFWVFLGDAVLSLSITVVWKLIKQDSIVDVNLGTYCILFTCTYVIFSILATCFSYLSVKYVLVSSYAFSLVCKTVLLYVSQRTFLKKFYPGNGNVIEVFGVVVCLLGMAILPTVESLLKPKFQSEEKDA